MGVVDDELNAQRFPASNAFSGAEESKDQKKPTQVVQRFNVDLTSEELAELDQKSKPKTKQSSGPSKLFHRKKKEEVSRPSERPIDVRNSRASCSFYSKSKMPKREQLAHPLFLGSHRDVPGSTTSPSSSSAPIPISSVVKSSSGTTLIPPQSFNFPPPLTPIQMSCSAPHKNSVSSKDINSMPVPDSPGDKIGLFDPTDPFEGLSTFSASGLSDDPSEPIEELEFRLPGPSSTNLSSSFPSF